MPVRNTSTSLATRSGRTTTARMAIGASPSKKSVGRLKTKIGELLVPGNQDPWLKVRDRLNAILRGWSAYFGYGTRLMAYRAVDNHVYDAVRHFLRRRHKVQSRGTRSFPAQEIFGTYRVLRLRRVHLGPLPCNPLAGDPLPCDMR